MFSTNVVYVCGLLGRGLEFRGSSVSKAIRAYIKILRGQCTKKPINAIILKHGVKILVSHRNNIQTFSFNLLLAKLSVGLLILLFSP
jgi:hypothetical protein